jgi:hypothetical protein
MKKLSKIINSIGCDDKTIEIYTKNKDDEKVEIVEYHITTDPKAKPGTSEERKYLKHLLTKYAEDS